MLKSKEAKVSVLHHQCIGEGEDLVVVHGLFGSGDNWRAIAKRWSQHYQVWSVDLRNHGRSFHASGMSYSELAEDLYQWMLDVGLEKAHWLGHSMGGKAVMELALTHPECVDHLFIADIAPTAYAHEHDAIIAGLQMLERQGPWPSRKEADQALSVDVKNTSIRQFLLTNLTRSNEGLVLRLGLQYIVDGYDDIIAAPPALQRHAPFEGPTLVIRGENSDYIQPQHYALFETYFPQCQWVVLKAGHWLHAEQPDAFAQAVEHALSGDSA